MNCICEDIFFTCGLYDILTNICLIYKIEHNILYKFHLLYLLYISINYIIICFELGYYDTKYGNRWRKVIMKKLFAFLLASLLLLAVFAGCSGGNKPEPASPEGSKAPSSDATEPPQLQVEEGLERNAVKLPLTDKPVTFVMWTPNGTTFEGFADYEDNLVYQEMERRSGVNLDFIHPVTGSENENFQLLMAAETLPDFIHTIANYYIGGMDKAIEDGVALRLNEYAAKYMPNYIYYCTLNEDIRRQTLTDNGNLWGVHHIVDRPQGAWYGLGIRKDWLDKAGLEKPVYYSDLENVLTVFRDNFTLNGNGPLYLSFNGLSFGYSLIGSFNVASTQYINVDGEVRYSPLEPGFKEYLMKMNDWYNKGLIDIDSVTSYAFQAPNDYIVNGKIGVFDFIYTYTSIWKQAAEDPDWHVVALTTPIPDGKTYADVHVRQNNDWVRTGNSMAITPYCSDIELACKYWDYFFTDDGILLSNYGVEDVSFEYDADGNPQYNEQALSLNNISYTQTKYCLHNHPVFTIWSRELAPLDEDQKQAEAIWGMVDAAYVMPQGVTLTVEEGAEHSNLKSTIDTYVNENFTLFLTGQKSFDEWDNFIAQIKSMNVDRMIEIQQTALNRYYNRGKN